MTPASAQFAAALRAAMRHRGASNRGVAVVCGTTEAAVSQWRRGEHLPTLRCANKLAEALHAPDLLTLCVRLRSGTCIVCKGPFTDESGRRKYCSVRCRTYAAKGVSVSHPTDARQAAIDAYCRSCEPELACRTPRCELRAFSPLPLVTLERVEPATRVPRWTPERRAATALRSTAYWSDPANRAKQRLAVRAAMTPAVRARISAGVKRAKARAAA